MFPLSRGKHQAEATLAAHSFILFSVAQSLRIKLSFPSQCWLPRYYSGILSGYKDAISTMDRSQNTSVLAISSQRRSNTMNPAHFPNGRDVGEPFHRHKSIHHLLGGGKVADILLWKDRNLSAGVLAAATLLWYVFDVVEYNIIPLLSQIVAIAMLVIFIWSNAAPLLNIAPPRIPEVIVSEHAFRQIAQAVHYRLAYTVASLYEIACGKDLKKFLLVIGSLLLVSEVGSSYSFTSLLYLGFLCAHTLPALYQRYEVEVDHLIARGSEDIKRFYKRVDSNLFSKIPRGPVKTKVY